MQWSDRGTKPGEFNTPHSIAAYSKGNIYVADPGNRRIQVTRWRLPARCHIGVPVPPGIQPWIGPMPSADAAARQSGTPWAICIIPGPTQCLYSADAYPGRIYKLSLDGNVLGMLGMSGRETKEFGWIHELVCRNEHTVLAAELQNWRVQKLILK